MDSGPLLRALARVGRKLFLASKRFGPGRNGQPTVVFVAGVQRSGTNMIMDVLEQSRAIDAIHERDPRAYDNYMMRDERVIDHLIARHGRPVFAIKALHESERVRDLLDRFAPAKLIWVFRSPDAVIASNRKSWPEGRNMIDAVVENPEQGGWRSRRMTDLTLTAVRSAYSPTITAEAAQGLFYYYRNQLFYDQALDRDDRVLLLDYDALILDPAAAIQSMAAFVGVAATARMIGVPKVSDRRRTFRFDLPPSIRTLVDDMHARLCAVATRANDHTDKRA